MIGNLPHLDKTINLQKLAWLGAQVDQVNRHSCPDGLLAHDLELRLDR